MAAKRTHIRAVEPGEKPGAVARELTAKSVADAVEADSSRQVFLALQRRIAKAIDDPNIRGADLAALSRRLHELRRELEALDVAAEQEARESADVDDAEWEAI